MCTTVNLKTDIYEIDCSRKSKFGNPFYMGNENQRDEVCDKHWDWLISGLNGTQLIVKGFDNFWVINNLHTLIGKKCGCWCAPKRCHVDNLRKILSIQGKLNKT